MSSYLLQMQHLCETLERIALEDPNDIGEYGSPLYIVKRMQDYIAAEIGKLERDSQQALDYCQDSSYYDSFN